MSSLLESKCIGYDPNLFLQKPESFEYWVCSICTGVVNKPYDLPCGHLFCSGCLDEAMIRSRKCPQCRLAIPIQLNLSNSIRKLINGWSIQCGYSSVGCSWNDSIGFEERNLIEHNKVCGFQLKSCEKCERKLPLRFMNEHEQNECAERPFKCDTCKEIMPFKSKENHITASLIYPCINVIKCPNGCSLIDYSRCGSRKRKNSGCFNIGSLFAIDLTPDAKKYLLILRAQLALHNGICPLVEVNCAFTGCTFQGPRYTMDKHLQRSFATHIQSLQTQLNSERTARQLLETKLNNTDHEFVLQFRVANFNELSEKQDSGLFYFTDSLTKIERAFSLRCRRTGDFIELYVFYEKGELPFSCDCVLMIRKAHNDSIGCSKQFKHIFTDHVIGYGYARFSLYSEMILAGCLYQDDSVMFSAYISSSYTSKWLVEARNQVRSH